jgi:hypothetical protein
MWQARLCERLFDVFTLTPLTSAICHVGYWADLYLPSDCAKADVTNVASISVPYARWNINPPDGYSNVLSKKRSRTVLVQILSSASARR